MQCSCFRLTAYILVVTFATFSNVIGKPLPKKIINGQHLGNLQNNLKQPVGPDMNEQFRGGNLGLKKNFNVPGSFGLQQGVIPGLQGVQNNLNFAQQPKFPNVGAQNQNLRNFENINMQGQGANLPVNQGMAGQQVLGHGVFDFNQGNQNQVFQNQQFGMQNQQQGLQNQQNANLGNLGQQNINVQPVQNSFNAVPANVAKIPGQQFVEQNLMNRNAQFNVQNQQVGQANQQVNQQPGMAQGQGQVQHDKNNPMGLPSLEQIAKGEDGPHAGVAKDKKSLGEDQKPVVKKMENQPEKNEEDVHMQMAAPGGAQQAPDDAGDDQQVMQIAPAGQMQQQEGEADQIEAPKDDGAGVGQDGEQQLQQPLKAGGGGDTPQKEQEDGIPQAEPFPRRNVEAEAQAIKENEGPIPKADRGHRGHRVKTVLKPDVLNPPDHMEGIKMEQDGHLNKDYHKEIFLGHGHENYEQVSQEEMKTKLKDVFHKADTDGDGFMTAEELENWIILKVKEHFDEAKEENEKVFHQLDLDQDGYISWQEFQQQFLMARGIKEEEAAEHQGDIDDLPLPRKDKDLLVHYRFHWSDADGEDGDNKLDLEEFKAFRHPESSSRTSGRMIKDIIENLDTNKDEIITEEEFVALPPGEVVEEEWKKEDQAWVEERRQEFRKQIDINHDGKVDMEELKKYVDPANPNHAKVEAKNLVQMADNNKDGKLSLEEVLDNSELFLGSKMVDTARSFHDEF